MLSPIFGKSATDFGETRRRFSGNPSPILGKICHRLWENPSQTLGKSATDFGKISHRLWEAPFLGKTLSFLGKTCSVFEKNSVRFWEKQCPLLGKTVSVFGNNRLRFWKKHAPLLGRTGSVCSVFGKKTARFRGKLVWFLDWLGTKLKSHKFGFGFSRFRTGCLQSKSTGSKLEG